MARFLFAQLSKFVQFHFYVDEMIAQLISVNCREMLAELCSSAESGNLQRLQDIDEVDDGSPKRSPDDERIQCFFETLNQAQVKLDIARLRFMCESNSRANNLISSAATLNKYTNPSASDIIFMASSLALCRKLIRSKKFDALPARRIVEDVSRVLAVMVIERDRIKTLNVYEYLAAERLVYSIHEQAHEEKTNRLTIILNRVEKRKATCEESQTKKWPSDEVAVKSLSSQSKLLAIAFRDRDSLLLLHGKSALRMEKAKKKWIQTQEAGEKGFDKLRDRCLATLEKKIKKSSNEHDHALQVCNEMQGKHDVIEAQENIRLRAFNSICDSMIDSKCNVREAFQVYKARKMTYPLPFDVRKRIASFL